MTRTTYADAREPHTDLAGLETPAETALRAEVRAFAWAELEPRRTEIDEKRLSREWIPRLAERGYLGTLVARDKAERASGSARASPWPASSAASCRRRPRCGRSAGTSWPSRSRSSGRPTRSWTTSDRWCAAR